MTAPTVLMITTTFGRGASDRYLTNELADALVAQGARVLVAAVEWSTTTTGPVRYTQPSGVEVVTIQPFAPTVFGALARTAIKWTLSGFRVRREIRQYFGNEKIDLVIGFSPLVVTSVALAWALRHYHARGFAYLTDFFPYHQQAADQLRRGPAFTAGLIAESSIMRRFDVIGAMSPLGVDYVRRYYRLRADQRVELLNLWGETAAPEAGDRAALRRELGVPEAGALAIFGGQISEGRGIETILAVARVAQTARPDLTFLFIGRGRLEPLVTAHIAAGGSNVFLKGRVPRDRYLTLLTACEVGLVATIADTGVPTFPSKTIDYLRAGVPIVAAVEATTDYAEFVAANGFGTAVLAGDVAAMLAAITAIVDSPARAAAMRRAARIALDLHFDPNQAARRVLTLTIGYRATNTAS